MVEKSRQLFIILQKCDGKDETVSEKDDGNKNDNGSNNDMKQNSSIVYISSDSDSSVEFISQATASKEQKQIGRLNKKVADLERKLKKERKNIEHMGTTNNQNVQKNDLPIGDGTSNAAAFSSTAITTATPAFAPELTSSPKSSKSIDDSAGPSNLSEESYSDSFVEKVAAEIGADPNSLDIFIGMFEKDQ